MEVLFNSISNKTMARIIAANWNLLTIKNDGNNIQRSNKLVVQDKINVVSNQLDLDSVISFQSFGGHGGYRIGSLKAPKELAATMGSRSGS